MAVFVPPHRVAQFFDNPVAIGFKGIFLMKEMPLKKSMEQQRRQAVGRYRRGESIESICASMGRHPNWLTKWIDRYDPNDEHWACDRSRRPRTQPNKTPDAMESVVLVVRKRLRAEGQFSGAQAIRWELEDLALDDVPSIRTINRILRRHNVPGRRREPYCPKGTPYPALSADRPNRVHQADLVGPCYLVGPHRFYALNVVDLATGRCGLYPLPSKASQSVITGFWDVWRRLGMPEHLQVDNEMSFYGSRRYPRGMGALIRLCLLHGIQLRFVPQGEPWRNGVVEKFNEHYQQKLLDRVTIDSPEHLRIETLKFEDKHNRTWRYSKLHGQTPMRALQNAQCVLRHPPKDDPPRHPLKKPEQGQYHLVRLVRSNLKLDVFGEMFALPAELQYQYVVATVDVKEQKLKLFQDHRQIEEWNYRLR